MKDHEMQDDVEIVENEEAVDFFRDDDSPYYHHPDYPEFDGWRDLVW